MKRLVYLACAVLLCVGCRKTQPAETLVVNPIMAVHFLGDSTHLFLTDLLPALSGEERIGFRLSEGYEVRNFANAEFDLFGNNTLGNMDIVVNDSLSYSVCILPHKPFRLGLHSVTATDSTLRFGVREDNDWVTEPLHVLAYFQNDLMAEADLVFNEGDTVFNLDIRNLFGEKGRAFIRIFAESGESLYNDVLIPLQDGAPVCSVDQLTRHDDRAQILYSMLIDRFNNGNPDNDWKMNSPEVLDIVDYQGGDLCGITLKIQEGFFDSLGITTLWISPITQNPWDAWGYYSFRNGNKYDSTLAYTKYSGYHGYWPLYTTCLEKRFGTDKELKELLATAHAHNMNVILDYVANHMHIASPTLLEHPDWHTDSILPDGRRNFELWDEARLTTWFDVHIPTLDLERPEVCDAMTDSALYWLANYDFDGFRHDACKHIPEDYWRQLTHKMVTRFPDRHLWMIGETYGSPELIGTYIKSGMLNAQFDFNVYFTAIHAFAGDGSFRDIDRVIRESLAAYGAHHTMGNISGNHDQARFASLADGAVSFSEDPKEAGWTRNVAAASDLAYTRAIQLEVLNMTIPGVPCIYQGDEYAEIGAGDPDNRHMMRFDGLTDKEQEFRRKVQQLTDLRRHSLALIYGDYLPIYVDDDTLEFERVYLNEHVRVKMTRDQRSEIEVWYSPASQES